MINGNLEIILLKEGEGPPPPSNKDVKEGLTWKEVPYSLALPEVYYDKSTNQFYKKEGDIKTKEPLTVQQVLEIINDRYSWRLKIKTELVAIAPVDEIFVKIYYLSAKK